MKLAHEILVVCVCVYPHLKFALQGGGGAVSAVLVHHHHHVGQRVHPHLLHLQVLLQELPHRSTHINMAQQEYTISSVNDGVLRGKHCWFPERPQFGTERCLKES